jgi:hypothetical protein
MSDKEGKAVGARDRVSSRPSLRRIREKGKKSQDVGAEDKEEKEEEEEEEEEEGNVRNVSVLLVSPDGNQRLITFEVPITLDEFSILKAVMLPTTFIPPFVSILVFASIIHASTLGLRLSSSYLKGLQIYANFTPCTQLNDCPLRHELSPPLPPLNLI